MAIQKTVFLRCEKGVDNGWMIKSKPSVPLSSLPVKIKDGMMALGMDSVFEVQTANGWVNLFNSPDALSVAEIHAHKLQLGQDCEYDKQNLYYSQIYLENLIEVSLQQRIISVLDGDDGRPTVWHIIQRTLGGAGTSKMIKAQKIINETKLMDVPGLDVRKYHEIMKPALFVCNEQGKLLLDVGPTIIKNHLGPQDVAFNATVMK